MKVVHLVHLVQGIRYHVSWWKPTGEQDRKKDAPVEPVEPKPCLNRLKMSFFWRGAGHD
jgi:hypothetical protein